MSSHPSNLANVLLFYSYYTFFGDENWQSRYAVPRNRNHTLIQIQEKCLIGLHWLSSAQVQFFASKKICLIVELTQSIDHEINLLRQFWKNFNPYSQSHREYKMQVRMRPWKHDDHRPIGSMIVSGLLMVHMWVSPSLKRTNHGTEIEKGFCSPTFWLPAIFKCTSPSCIPGFGFEMCFYFKFTDFVFVRRLKELRMMDLFWRFPFPERLLE